MWKKRFVFRERLERTEQGKETLFCELLVTFCLSFADFLLSLCQVLCSKLTLYSHDFFYERLIFLKHLVVTFRNRTRDDQRSTCIINQHAIYLIDDGIVVCALDEVLW